MTAVATLLGWLVIGSVGPLCLALIVDITVTAVERWRDRRRRSDLIERLADQGEVLLQMERNGRAMQ